MRWILLLLLLAGCGGGGGGSSNTVTPPPAPHAIDFTFFGQSDTAVTAPFTSAYHAVDWGPANATESIKLRIINELQQAKARGITKFIVSTGFLTLDANCNYLGNAALAAFKVQLDALGLDVWMAYPVDEPDVRGCSGAVMAQVYQGTKAIFPNARIGVIYGDTGRTPGIDQVTDAGKDKYGSGPQSLNLRPDQHLMIVAGGANPYREDVQQYVDFAEGRPVSLVWAFLYVNYTDPSGHPALGIGANGMLPAYKAAGCKLTMKCAAGS